MKKIFAISLSLVICIGMMGGCAKGDEPDTLAVKEIYDVGEFKVTVPEGWKTIAITDPFTEGHPVKTDCVFLRKGGESDRNAFEKPYIRIEYCKTEPKIPNQELFSNIEPLEPFKLGDLTWNGYTADEYHGKAHIGRFADMWAECGECFFHTFIWFESGGDSIKLSDPDVQMILASLSPAML